jgi:hypothetical protein
MYGEVLSAANPAALLSSVHQSLVHPVMADPGSIAPTTSQVGAKMGVLAQLKLQQVELSESRKASHDGRIQLSAALADMDEKIANYRYDPDPCKHKSWETAETKKIWKQIGWGKDSKWQNIGDHTVTISLPNTPVKECLLSARQRLLAKQEQFVKADQAETKLAGDIAALRAELPRWRQLLFFSSGNGRLLNRHRFACFLVISLVLSSALLYLSSDGSARDPAGTKVDGGGAGSVYGMLRAHCDHVPANSDGAYFDFWTIWVLIMAYCTVSALFVSRALLHDLAQALLERAAGCICLIDFCRCGKTITTQQAGQRCSCCAVGIIICLLSLSCCAL